MKLNRHAESKRFPVPPTGGGQTGFTLIELVVTISVGAILTAIAIPAFQSFVMNDRDSAQVNSLAYSFNYARSEAVKQDLAGGVTVCPYTAGPVPCTGGAGWQQGWVVYFTDSNGNVQILQTVPALSSNSGTTVTATGSATTGITFLSSGMATPLAGSMTSSLQITVCDQRGAAYARDVEVNVAGRVAASQKVGLAVNQTTSLVCP